MFYDNEISMGIMEKKYLQPGETPEQWLDRVVSIFSPDLQDDIRYAISQADFLPAGRTLAGAGLKGKRKMSTSNCYICPSPKDNIESIFDTAKMVARISSYGGGCGIALDNLRPKDALVNNSARTSTGAVSFLNLFDTTGSIIGQAGRRAALMVGLRCDHPDIYEFLRIKENNEKLASMNISIKFTDEFMEAVHYNKKFHLHFESEHENIERDIDAAEFFEEFCKVNADWGDPGCIFIDRVRKYHLLSGYTEYQIDISNPCAEYYGIGGNSCNLGSINLYNMIDDKFTREAHVNYERLGTVVNIAVQALDEILTYGYGMQPLDLNRKVIDDWRSIGLGIFGLADALVAMGIRYGSEESIDFVSEVMEYIMLCALGASSDLAHNLGPFGKYDFDKICESPIIQAFPDMMEKIKADGLRNGSLLSIAPTGTISLFAGRFTGGVEPMYQVAYERTSHSTEDEGKTFFVYARGVEDLLKFHGIDPQKITVDEIKARFPFVIESHEVPWKERVALQGVMQDYVDNSISSTVNLPNSATWEDIRDIYMFAWGQGLKGITVFRDGCKRGNILGVSKDEPVESTYNMVEPLKRGSTYRVDGSTFKQRTACVPSMYVTVNKSDTGDLMEVFTNASGGCQANINTITRLVSLLLRAGVKRDIVIEELRENQCPACQTLRRQGKSLSLSCGNAIADAMTAMLDDETTVEHDGYLVCPECGKHTLRPEGKCFTCSNCGYSKCD